MGSSWWWVLSMPAGRSSSSLDVVSLQPAASRACQNIQQAIRTNACHTGVIFACHRSSACLQVGCTTVLLGFGQQLLGALHPLPHKLFHFPGHVEVGGREVAPVGREVQQARS